MKLPCVLSLVLSVGSLLPAPAFAQTIYRCGNSYSQMPCAGGRAIESDDHRDKTQKAQTEAAARRDLKAASALEKNRIRQEATQARAARPYRDASSYDMLLNEATTEHRYDNGKKSRKPEHFTAKTLGEPHPKKKAHTAGAGNTSKPDDTRR